MSPLARSVCLIVFMTAACGVVPFARPSSQETYTFEDCSLEDYGCPRLMTVFCAKDRIEQRADRRCSVDLDCVAATPPLNDCAGLYSCNQAAVSREGRINFEGQIQAEVDRYCATKTCASSGSCLVESGVIRCVSGQCGFVPSDGGAQ